MTDTLTRNNFKTCEQLFADSQNQKFPAKFKILGRDFVLHKDVFSPITFRCATAVVPELPLASGQSMLDMGCGTGVMGINAILEYDLARVLCADIMRPAVKNAAANVRLHKLKDKVSVVQSDMFDNIGEDKKFDLIFWNSPYLDHPHSNESQELNHMMADPGYAAHKRYINGGFERLKSGGRLMLMISEHYFPLSYMNDRLSWFGAHAEVFAKAKDDSGKQQLLLNVVRVR